MKPRIMSAIANTGKVTLGNYIGAMQNLIDLQEENELFIFVANLHAIISLKNPKLLKKSISELVSLYLACGINPKKTTIFVQSDILEHCQLGHLLLCHTSIGELSRMTQYKDKSQNITKKNNTQTIPTGLFTYPTLMAADILLYDANFVFVGEDQQQHLELTRDIAIRMNNKYEKELFTIPQSKINKIGKRIMNLQNPIKKMSKSSDNPKTYIALLDDLDDVRKKINSAITDNENKVYFDEKNKPGISNLLKIYCSLTHKSIEIATQEFSETNYNIFKEKVSDVVCEHLAKIQQRYKEIITSDEWKKVLADGKNKAKNIAEKKLKLIQDTLGINY